MNNNRKKRANVDRLSSLPECLLIHILSLAPTKYAARTSVLSKRWRDLFMNVSRIHIEHSETPPQIHRYIQSLGIRSHDDFEIFVNRLLLSTSPSTDEFRLKCPAFSRDSLVYMWLAHLLRRGIKVLEIEQVNILTLQQILGGQQIQNKVAPIEPPTGFFQSKTLVVLKLRGGIFSFEFDKSICLPNLKVLSLKSLAVQYLKSKTWRFSDQGYPILQDLSLEDLSLKDLSPNYDDYLPITTIMEISLRDLQRLTVIDLPFARIDVDTPHLQHLNCNIWRQSVMNLRKCETQKSAVFSVSSKRFFNGKAFNDALRRVNNVKVLRIDLMTGVPEAYKVDPHQLPIFHNLEQLEFEHSPSTESKNLLWVLLHCAPNLRALNLSMDDFGEHISPSMTAPSCFGRNLSRIRLELFKWTDAEVALVEWMLEHGTKLQEIIIDSQQSGDVLNNVKTTAMNRLVKIGKRYPECEIVFA